MSDIKVRAKLRKLAKKFDIDAFRPGQEDTMIYVLRGEDTLAIMPTGAGKSLCYQLPAELMQKTTIVVSPLISLMKDQHQKIVDMGFISQPLSSELTRKQTASAIQNLGDGKMDIQFVTPEKLENPEVLKAFHRSGVSLFVVDEAHCISEWGHDFRPAYRGLKKAIEALGHPPVLALTATATPEVIVDIQDLLGFKSQSHVVKISYRRDNIILKAREFKTEAQKYAALLKILSQLKLLGTMCGIIYCASVKETDWLFDELTSLGLPVLKYHGRLKKSQRKLAQDTFMKEGGPGYLMIATSAFGMGIDKADVRFVINYQIPNSVESYCQEVGRVGRDGKKSLGILFYSRKDMALQRVLQLRKYPSSDAVWQTVSTVFENSQQHETNQAEIEAKVGRKKIALVLRALEKGGFVALRGKAVTLIRRPSEKEVQKILTDWDQHRREERARLDEVTRYVRSGLCRWYYLLRYFGEAMSDSCGHCDNCRKHVSQPAEPLHYVKGDYVHHPAWGLGEVIQKVGPNLRVFFPGVGEKILREAFLTKKAA
jgi:ATP-dependent DNA helicase RecQ